VKTRLWSGPTPLLASSSGMLIFAAVVGMAAEYTHPRSG
jgi:hypothetical protein